MLAFLLVLVNLHTVKDVCQDSHPGVAQQNKDDSMALVVEGRLTAWVVESCTLESASSKLSQDQA